MITMVFFSEKGWMVTKLRKIWKFIKGLFKSDEDETMEEWTDRQW
jgi:hypothetical protein